jgi:hypothetical protein
VSVREPTREQRAAIDVRGRDVLLEAGAGSGPERFAERSGSSRVA